jgi:hypothetical protein
MLPTLLLPLTFAVADVPRADTRADRDVFFLADLSPAGQWYQVSWGGEGTVSPAQPVNRR